MSKCCKKYLNNVNFKFCPECGENLGQNTAETAKKLLETEFDVKYMTITDFDIQKQYNFSYDGKYGGLPGYTPGIQSEEKTYEIVGVCKRYLKPDAQNFTTINGKVKMRQIIQSLGTITIDNLNVIDRCDVKSSATSSSITLEFIQSTGAYKFQESLLDALSKLPELYYNPADHIIYTWEELAEKFEKTFQYRSIVRPTKKWSKNKFVEIYEMGNIMAQITSLENQRQNGFLGIFRHTKPLINPLISFMIEMNIGQTPAECEDIILDAIERRVERSDKNKK